MYIQGVIQALFEIGSQFWAHKNWRPNFDELAKKIKPQFDIGSFQSRSPKPANEGSSISLKFSPFVTINEISIS